MKEHICLLIAILGFIVIGKAQTYNHMDSKIYNSAIVPYGHGDDTLSRFAQFSPETSDIIIKMFNFKHPDYHSLNRQGFKLGADWLSFLQSVDTAKIANSMLNVAGLHFANPHIKISDGDRSRLFTFSSQIISADGSKAVIGMRNYGGSEDSAGDIILLEKKDNEWVIYKVINMYIS